MTDRFGRNIDYMRISITDRCNLNCSYCRPEVSEHLKHYELLSYAEGLRIARIAVKLGIHRFKVTGGEPFVRRGAEGFICDLCRLSGAESVTVTTNGTLLDEDIIRRLKAAGIDGINISLDTLEPERFVRITGSGYFQEVLDNIDKCLDSGIRVKVNAVLLPDIDESDIMALTGLARDRDIAVRFIELMPMVNIHTGGPSGKYVRDILDSKGIILASETEKLGNGPATYYRLNGYKGHVGFIEAIHGKFCSSCNRIRMTSTGFVKPCLYHTAGMDLREIIRSGADDDTILGKLRDIIYMKPESHEFEDRPAEEKMSDIGG